MNIFVSYSPADIDLVGAIIAVLGANNRSLSYCDADSMRTSGRWQRDLGPAISESSVVLLFWCHHSLTSYEVRKEFTLALEQGKEVIPLLLDSTPLPSRLASLGCIDFRDRALGIHEGPAEQPVTWALTGQIDADRRIASGISRQYEELLLMSLAREIEAELAARLRPR